MKKQKKLKEFGAGSSTIEWGYDLEMLVGHIEALTHSEEENDLSKRGQERLSKVEDALQLLTEALEY
jgi:hypothetical protein